MTTRNAATMGNYQAAWEARGYCGHGTVGEQVGRLAGRTAIVAGSAEGVFDEVQYAREHVEEECVIFGVNDAGIYLPTLDHWVSLHADNLVVWKSVRWLHSRAQDRTEFHSVSERPYIDHVWDRMTPLMAISGYFAMQVAFVMGCSRIILCGCPGDSRRKFYEHAPRADFSYGRDGIREQFEHEMKRLAELRASVRSMSGYTREFLGGPEEWFQSKT